MTYPQVSGLVFMRVLLARNPALFSSAALSMLLPQLRMNRDQIYSYLSVVSPEPNTVLGIENILSMYLLNEFSFLVRTRRNGCGSKALVPISLLSAPLTSLQAVLV